MMPKKLADKIQEKFIPFSASLELTWKCNLHCQFCYQRAPGKGELNTAEVKDILDQLQECGCLILSLTGGEPLVRSDFWDIMKYAGAKHFSITLQTNGTLITRPAAKKLTKFPIFCVHISILGTAADTHDTMTGHKGSFDKALKAASYLRANRIPVIFKVTVTKNNYREIDDIHRLAKKYDCDLVFSPVIYPRNDGNLIPLKFRLDDSELKAFYHWVFKRFPAQAKPFKKGEYGPTCQFGQTDCCISPYGKVYPCVTVPMEAGDLRKQRFIAIWQNSRILKKIRCTGLDNLVECSRCNIAASCIRCSGLSFLEDKKMNAAARECCRMTKIIMGVISDE